MPSIPTRLAIWFGATALLFGVIGGSMMHADRKDVRQAAPPNAAQSPAAQSPPAHSPAAQSGAPSAVLQAPQLPPEQQAQAQPSTAPQQPAPDTEPTPENLPPQEARAMAGVESAPPRTNTISLGHQAGLHRVKDGLGLTASAAVLVDPARSELLFAKNPDAVLPIASLTKMMTALIVGESRAPLDETITISEDDVDHERNSRSRLRVGTTLTRAEALHLALMSSENRAAHALGRHHPGGLPAFVAAMNAKARALGMSKTTFVDPTGLSTSNQSTARDLSVLALTASRDPLVREYSTTKTREVTFDNGRTLRYLNSNRLVKNPAWDIHMQKTGYIVEAGQCLAMLTRIAGRDLVMVILDAGSKTTRSTDAERLRRFVGGAPEPVVHQAAAAKPALRKVSTARKAAPDRKAAESKRVKKTFAGKPRATREASSTKRTATKS